MIFRCEANWCIYFSERIIGSLMSRLFIPKLVSTVNLLHLFRIEIPYKGNPTHSRGKVRREAGTGIFVSVHSAGVLAALSSRSLALRAGFLLFERSEFRNPVRGFSQTPRG